MGNDLIWDKAGDNSFQQDRACLAYVPGGKPARLVSGDDQTALLGEDATFETLPGQPGHMVSAVDQDDVEGKG